MKKFKHKKTGYEVVQMDNFHYKLIHAVNHIPNFIIENSNEWEEIVKENYKILSFINDIGEYYPLTGDDRYRCGKKWADLHHMLNHAKYNCRINSIKRLSDGEVFTIKDIIRVNHSKEKEIISIKIVGDEVRLIVSNTPTTWYDFNYAKKVSDQINGKNFKILGYYIDNFSGEKIINSIKRVSDGKVFNTFHKVYDEYHKTSAHIIQKFTIFNDFVNVHTDKCILYFDKINHAKEVDESLFTSEEIKLGDILRPIKNFGQGEVILNDFFIVEEIRTYRRNEEDTIIVVWNENISDKTNIPMWETKHKQFKRSELFEYFEKSDTPRLITEDGVKLYSFKDNCWSVDLKTMKSDYVPRIHDWMKDRGDFKWFSTEELAKEYIANTKRNIH